MTTSPHLPGWDVEEASVSGRSKPLYIRLGGPIDPGKWEEASQGLISIHALRALRGRGPQVLLIGSAGADDESNDAVAANGPSSPTKTSPPQSLRARWAERLPLLLVPIMRRARISNSSDLDSALFQIIA